VKRISGSLLGNSITGTVFELLLFALIPSGYICQISGHTGDLRYIMTPAFRTDWLATEGAVFNSLCDTVGAVAVVKRAHDHQLCFTTGGAGCVIDDMVTGVALVLAFFNGDIFKSGIFIFKAELFRRPVHRDLFSHLVYKIMGCAIRNNL
jgi:hypothetical protein